MTLEINFYFRLLKDEAVECTSILSDSVKGFGKTNDEAQDDYLKNYNEWSSKVKEETKKILDRKNLVYFMQDYKFYLSK